VLYEKYHEKSIEDGMTINHINGIKDDNRICNLEAVSHKHNQQHRVKFFWTQEYIQKFAVLIYHQKNMLITSLFY
jgi:hypothetical protein